jgi:hypothetical protein
MKMLNGIFKRQELFSEIMSDRLQIMGKNYPCMVRYPPGKEAGFSSKGIAFGPYMH